MDSGSLDQSSFTLRCEVLMRSFGEVPPEVSRVVLGAGPLAAGLGFYEVAIAVFLPLEGVSITDVGANPDHVWTRSCGLQYSLFDSLGSLRAKDADVHWRSSFYAGNDCSRIDIILLHS